MHKKELAIMLSRLKPFEKPLLLLEQYPTDPEIAAETIWAAYLNKEIEGKTMADLGCGTGILGIGALLLGAKRVYFVDLDQRALNIALQNIRDLKKDLLGEAVVCHEDVTSFKDKVDVVIMNPPFGTKNKQADTIFLEQAFKISKKIYSFHKTSTKGYVAQFGKKHGFSLTACKDYSFPLKKTQPMHKDAIQNINVTLFRFERN